MSGSSCFHTTPIFKLHPDDIFIVFFLQPSRKSHWFIHRLQFCVWHLQTQYMTEWHIGQLCVIIQHHLLLNDNIHCICPLVIECLWCLSPVLQCQASRLCCHEIYWSTDCLTLLTSYTMFITQRNNQVHHFTFFLHSCCKAWQLSSDWNLNFMVKYVFCSI